MKRPNITPGPWKYHLGRGKNPRFHVQTSAGYQIASTPELKTPRTVTLAAEFEENTTFEANAAAIAAVPDLLEALERLLRCPDLAFDAVEPESIEAMQAALAALTKAGYQF